MAATRKSLLALAAVAALILAIPIVRLSLASPESRIRRHLQQMASDFDRGRAGPCARGLSEEFRDDTTGAGASEVRAILAQMSLAERDPETKEFLHRVTLADEEMTVAIDAADPTRARVDLIATFEELHGGEWRLEWRVAISAEMRDEDGGWRVLRTTHETLAGHRFR